MFGLTPVRHNAVGRANGYGDFYNAIDNFFNDDWSLGVKGFRMDVKEDPEKYTIEAEMPGINKEEISLDYDKDTLYIAVDQHRETEEKPDKEDKAHKEAKEKAEGRYIHRERCTTSMRRAIYLNNVNKEGITAKLENGVLTVVAPKLEKTQEKYKINIQ